ncbi:hypothetical protein FB45DRAFT_299163 [Roridomyces roridus]|uniref:Uncharacterized protein n=1 Tax=Roridomyces roridus TaxID=1738132 RepID=A0AAD7CC37_9AGAR|nr:hypothetical protein FB45DRAFT_299163 [Roridomyces roridus]
MSKRLPIELWHEILLLISRERRRDLEHVYATDRTLRAISRPLLFSHLVFHPYHRVATENQAHPEPALPSPEAVQFALDRLEFWSSDEIAPFVQECEVAPRYRYCESEEEAELQPHTDSLHILMTSFLNCLRKFTNIKKFSAESANFTQAGLCNLCQLPLLREVVIRWCNIVPGETIDMTGLELPTLKLVYWAGGDASQGPNNLWLTVVNRKHLRELEWSGTAAGDAVSQGPAFSNVHTLAFSANLGTMNLNLALLSKFPAVRTLRGSGWGDSNDEPADVPLWRVSDVLPLLQEYRGTCRFLKTFLPKPTLARLVLDDGLTTPGILLSQLDGQYGHITSLDATLTNLDHHVLSTICISLPGLIDLRIRIGYLEDDEIDEYENGVNTRATDFFSTLKDTHRLPSTLQRLALSWEFDFEYFEDNEQGPPTALPENVPDFFEIREKLRERCPALRTLWLDGHDFMFKWRQMVDREEVEQENEIEASEIFYVREKFEDFWQGR